MHALFPFTTNNGNQNDPQEEFSASKRATARRPQRRGVLLSTTGLLTVSLALASGLTGCSTSKSANANAETPAEQAELIQLVSSAAAPEDSAITAPPAVADSQLLVRQNGDAPAANPRYLGYALVPGQNDFNNAIANLVTTSWYDRPEQVLKENPYLTSLNVRWSLPVNQGKVIGERLDMRWYNKDEELLSESRSFYTQIGSNSLVRDDQLVAPAKHVELAEVIYRALADASKLDPRQASAPDGASKQSGTQAAEQAGAQQKQQKPGKPSNDKDAALKQKFAQAHKVIAPQALLQSLQLRNDGSAILRIPAQLLPASTQTPLWAVFPKEVIRRYLSPAGTQIENAILAANEDSQQDKAVQLPAASAQLQALAASAPVPQTLQTPPDCRKLKCVALTYDDGPSKNTRKLIQELQAAHAPATFFYVGQYVAADPETVKLALAAGITVGSHSYTHPDLESLSPQKVEEELVKTNDVIREASGNTYLPFLLRPPYGNARAREKQIAADLGMPIIIWDVDTQDWKNRDSKITQDLLFKEVRPGSIILMHDVRETSVAATPEIIKRLRADGYTLVSVPDLLLGSMKPGERSCSQDFTGDKSCGVW